MFNDQVILITGGTGSFGKEFIKTVFQYYKPRKLIVLSRDEQKQLEMRQLFPEDKYPSIRYFIGDVRDRDRLNRAFHGVDFVIHAAALKQVPACEYNPFEAVQTNIMGAKNVIDAAIDNKVKRVMAISTDKAVNPTNLYGATKLVTEKLFIQGNYYAAGQTVLSCVRYGNVVGSRGSVIPLFLEQRQTGVITVTDPRMTRFWITLKQVAEFVIHCLTQMQGGEVFVPKIPSMRLTDLAEAIAPGCEIVFNGIRPGEKIHEMLLSDDEIHRTLEFDDFFIVKPEFDFWREKHWENGRRLPLEFRYTSDTNTQWLLIEELKQMIPELESV